MLNSGALLNVGVVQAADFFADEATVADMCAAVGHRLLHCAQGQDADHATRAQVCKTRRTESSAADSISTSPHELSGNVSSSLQPLEVRPRTVLPDLAYSPCPGFLSPQPTHISQPVII